MMGRFKIFDDEGGNVKGTSSLEKNVGMVECPKRGTFYRKQKKKGK